MSDRDLEKAMLNLLREDHVLAEPGGAAAVASIMCSSPPTLGANVVAVVTGGNISISYLTRLLNSQTNA